METLMQPASLNELMRLIDDIPLPGALAQWASILLIEVTDYPGLYYEWVPCGDHLEVEPGRPETPDLLIRGRAIDLVRFYSRAILAEGMPLELCPIDHKRRWSLGDTTKHGMLRVRIAQQVKPHAEHLRAAAEKEHNLRLGQVQTLAGAQAAQASEKAPRETEKMPGGPLNEARYLAARVVIYQAIQDILGQLSPRSVKAVDDGRPLVDLLSESCLNVKFYAKIHPTVSDDAAGKAFFDGLRSSGSMLNEAAPHYNYCAAPWAEPNLSPSLGSFILFYARCLAGMVEQPLSAPVLTQAYEFFLHDLQAMFIGGGFLFQSSETLLDWRVLMSGRASSRSALFLLITNRRILALRDGKSQAELTLQHGEDVPVLRFYQSLDSGWRYCLVFQTPLRLIRYHWAVRPPAHPFYESPAPGEIFLAALVTRSKDCLLAATNHQLIIWRERGPVLRIPLSQVSGIDKSLSTIQRHGPSGDYQKASLRLVLRAAPPHVYPVALDDSDGSETFVARVTAGLR